MRFSFCRSSELARLAKSPSTIDLDTNKSIRRSNIGIVNQKRDNKVMTLPNTRANDEKQVYTETNSGDST